MFSAVVVLKVVGGAAAAFAAGYFAGWTRAWLRRLVSVA